MLYLAQGHAADNPQSPGSPEGSLQGVQGPKAEAEGGPSIQGLQSPAASTPGQTGLGGGCTPPAPVTQPGPCWLLRHRPDFQPQNWEVGRALGSDLVQPS